PILRVRAPLPVAQIVETLVINRLQFSTMIASKAARVRFAAKDALVVDFGMRRAHGLDAARLAARAAYIGGLDGTSNVEAGMRDGVPIFGTMAHSFVQSFANEREAFRAFAKTWPKNAVLLVDTYDTLAGVDTAIALAKAGVPVRGIRIDSGDLAGLAREARRMLDAAGLEKVTIFASGNLDEYAIDELFGVGAPIDGFGVGTKLTTSADAPYLDCAYKLQEVGGRPVFKKSAGKATLPGTKQVWRFFEGERFVRDLVSCADETIEGARPLLRPVMRKGELLDPPRPAAAIRDAVRARLAQLPEALRTLEQAPAYPVEISEKLRALAQRLAG
ncbi:MAG: nicotinate phosphoribosyltransferase, partial [Zetaproteobacteria bacterium]